MHDVETLGIINKIPNNLKGKHKILKFKKNQLITIKGNTIEKIYISLQGKMEVKNEFENGFIYNFAAIDSIAYIGVMEIMAGEDTYSSTLQTTTECTMIEMNVVDFKNWIANDHGLTLDVLKFVSISMYRESINKGEVLAYPAIYSLVNYLINAYKNQNNDTLTLEKSREEIGSTLGFSIRTINRNLKVLKEENLVSINRQVISISKEQYKKLLDKLNSIK